ncbi:MAG: hypothetical protein Q8906_04320 [Bacillota bacterium]|nr:hypothetical protein [Bacillota bacterium]MDP4169813.1 hypothetical protein [Bacillota bacterium]
MKKYVILAGAMSLCLIGCNKSAEKGYDIKKDRNTPQFMSYKPKPAGTNQNKPVGNDFTNQNPNFLNLNGTSSGSSASTSMGLDVNKAKQTIGQMKDLSPGSIWIHGDTMRVTAYKKGTLTNREKAIVEARLQRKLIQALPRYTIKVNVTEKK